MTQQTFWAFEVFGSDPNLIGFFGNAGIIIPSGTTAQRPSTPVEGHIRLNTDTVSFEGFFGGIWQAIGSGGGGASTFIGLTDTPGTYVGQANRVMRVSSGETGVEFTNALVLDNTGRVRFGTASYETLVTTDDVATNKKYVDDQDNLQLSLSGGLMTGNITMGGNTIIGLPLAPTLSTEAASKAYVDSLAAGFDFKESVHVATEASSPGNLAGTYDNTAGGGGPGFGATLTATTPGVLPFLDGHGHPSFSGDLRILVKDQTDATENGLYVITNPGAGENFTFATCMPDVADSLDGTRWTFFDGGGQFYVWYDTPAGAGDPGGPGTGIMVTIGTGDSAQAVASATVAAINGSAALVTAGVGADLITVHVLDDATGVRTAASDVDTGFTVSTPIPGTGTPVAWVLTRTTDADNTPNQEVSGGMFTIVEHGSMQAGTAWLLTSPVGDATLGTDDLVFNQFAGGGGAFLPLAGGVMAGSIVMGAPGIQVLGDIVVPTAPAYSFAGDPGTGVHQVTGPGAIDFISGTSPNWVMLPAPGALVPATAAQDIGTTGVKVSNVYADHILNNFNAAGDPSFSFEGDTDTGMYNGGGDILGFATAGTERISIGATGVITFNTAYAFPTADGTADGQVLTTDGAGTLTFRAQDTLADDDGDTSITVEAAADEDVIRMNTGEGIAGYPAATDVVVIDSSQVTVLLPTPNLPGNAGGSLSFTAGAGNSDDGGAIDIIAGTGGADGAGGEITLTAGTGGSDSSGGGIFLEAGGGVGSGSGGGIDLTAGENGATGSTGGNINLTSGESSSTTTGQINLVTADSGAAGVTSGRIRLETGTSIDPALPGDIELVLGHRVLDSNLAASVLIGTKAAGGSNLPSLRFLEAGNGSVIGTDYVGLMAPVLGFTAGAFTIQLPRAAATSAGQVLRTNAGDTTLLEFADGGIALVDGDGDTRVMVEEAADEDVIRFDVGNASGTHGPIDDIMTLSAPAVDITMGTATSDVVGGTIDFTAGKGGATSAGGAVTITGGAGGTTSGDGGNVDLLGGNADGGGTGGAVTMTAGAGASAGGPITLLAGAAGSPGFVGGAVDITAGQGNSADGGAITLTAGAGGKQATGGAINIFSGGPGAPGNSGDGGAINLTAANGLGSTSGVGGNVNITAGNTVGSGAGGAIVLNAGNSTTSTGDGGDIELRAGSTVGGSDGVVRVIGPTAGAGRLVLEDDAGGEFVGLQAPSTITTSYTLTMPTAAPGALSFVQVDPAGTVSFALGSTVSVPKIIDADGDTKVDVEEGADDDTIRFDVGPSGPHSEAITDLFIMDNSRIRLGGKNSVTGDGHDLSLLAGDGTGEGAGNGGFVSIKSGTPQDNGNGGALDILAGGPGGAMGNVGGNLTISTENNGNAISSQTGSITIQTGNNTVGGSGDGGAIDILAGDGRGGSKGGGAINITGGDGSTTANGRGGTVTISGGASGASGAGQSSGDDAGNVIINGGSAQGIGFSFGGNIELNAGLGGSTSGSGGSVDINAGRGRQGGSVTIDSGRSQQDGNNGGPITITAGNTNGGNGTGGLINITAGGVENGSGDGGPITIATGAGQGGGAESGPADGGDLLITTGDAGNDRGSGGDVTFTLGRGAPSATSPGSAGGTFMVTAGQGGIEDGDPGNIILTAGAAAGTTPGNDGGRVDITAGAGSGSQNGGAVNISGGAQGTGGGTGAGQAGGAVVIDGGTGFNSGTGGAINISGGSGTGGGTGGEVTIDGGGAQGSGDGGVVTITGGIAGIGATGGNGGDVVLVATASGGANQGGLIDIDAGKGGPTGAGGTIDLTAGAGGTTSGAGGDINLTAGNADGSGAGGMVNITAGTGASPGGAVVITAGNSTATDDGGDIELRPGTSSGSGADGVVRVIGPTAGAGSIALEDDAGGEFVAFSAPSAITTSYTLVMPVADAAGALTSDGAGTLSFSTTGGTALTDADLDTKVDVEEGADDDTIRFDVGDSPTGYGAVADILTINSSAMAISMGTATGTDTIGASIMATAGIGTGTGRGGPVTLFAGASGGTGQGGSFSTGAGSGGAGSADGGSWNGGAGFGGATGGAGGNARLFGGAALATGNDGGNIVLFAGPGPAGLIGDGGDVFLHGGTPGDTGDFGQVLWGGFGGTDQGSAALPGLAMVGDPTTGFYSVPAGGILNVAVGGAKQMGIDELLVDIVPSGDKGAITLTAGAATTAGTGGAISFTTGAGDGAGDGGAFTFTGGAGGATGDGGNFDVTLAGGTGSTTTGGSINLLAGDSATETGASGGSITLTAGDGDGTTGTGGVIDINAGAAESNNGGAVTINAGNAGSNGGNPYTGGAVTITAGNGAGLEGTGGAVTLQGGSASSGNGGAINLTAGNAVGANGASHSGGAVNITAGDGDGLAGEGGAVNINGGAAASGDGGAVVITAGSAGGATDYDGGDIELRPGALANSGTDGVVRVIGPSAGAGEMRLEDDAGGQYFGLKAAATIPTSFTLTSPTALPVVSGSALVSDTSGNLSFSTAAVPSKFAATNITAVATEAFTHSLGTEDVIVQIQDLTVSPQEVMIADIEITDANTVTITLAVAPGIGDYRVVIIG